MSLLPVRAIEKKRQGEVLSKKEMEAFFLGYLRGEIPEYQMSALLMAIHFRGLGSEELHTLLELMIGSGAILDFSYLPGPRVDKHSTGGVGDKTSLVLAPLAAASGAFIPMISGRGLGHTTGTLDKLEAIPGFETKIPLEQFRRILEEVGVAMMGQTEEIAPLDRRLYALRDATATVPSIPLIAASIMSKKLAEGLQGLVLDVKTGRGAFLGEAGESLTLARTMVELGEGRGVRTVALVTGMDAPLGRAVGNALETREALTCLLGEGPADLRELSVALVGEMLHTVGLASSPAEGEGLAGRVLADGRGVERMARLVAAQGGDSRVVEDPTLIPVAPYRSVVESLTEGFVETVDPLRLGYGVVELGGGRRKAEDGIDPGVGFLVDVRPGDRVEAGTPLGTVFASDMAMAGKGAEILRGAARIGPEEPSSGLPLVRYRIPDPLQSTGGTDSRSGVG